MEVFSVAFTVTFRFFSVATKRPKTAKKVEPIEQISMAYICRLHRRPGTLLLERCVEKGVPPGPLLGRLKSGQDVTLENGTVVKSSDVCSPDDPGPVFIGQFMVYTSLSLKVGCISSIT